MDDNRRLNPAQRAFTEFGHAAQRAEQVTRRFIHNAFHHGEGQVPRTCDLCREALNGR